MQPFLLLYVWFSWRHYTLPRRLMMKRLSDDVHDTRYAWPSHAKYGWAVRDTRSYLQGKSRWQRCELQEFKTLHSGRVQQQITSSLIITRLRMTSTTSMALTAVWIVWMADVGSKSLERLLGSWTSWTQLQRRSRMSNSLVNWLILILLLSEYRPEVEVTPELNPSETAIVDRERITQSIP